MLRVEDFVVGGDRDDLDDLGVYFEFVGERGVLEVFQDSGGMYLVLEGL